MSRNWKPYQGIGFKDMIEYDLCNKFVQEDLLSKCMHTNADDPVKNCNLWRGYASIPLLKPDIKLISAS